MHNAHCAVHHYRTDKPNRGCWRGGHLLSSRRWLSTAKLPMEREWNEHQRRNCHVPYPEQRSAFPGRHLCCASYELCRLVQQLSCHADCHSATALHQSTAWYAWLVARGG